MFVLKLFFTIILADFVSGLVHWLEDAYARPGMPLFGRIAEENLQHHARPRAFLAKGWWESSHDLLLVGLLTILLSLWLEMFSGWMLLFVLVTVNANQIHKWAHQGPRENPALVALLQKWQILQTPRGHARHHRGSRDSHYCVITNVLNPVLESMDLWRRMEAVVESIFGMRRRSDAEYAGMAGQ